MRPAIVRRSCDHCRIACDRASPCSNCVVAKLECKHSQIAAKAKVQQREVPAFKIDKIAEDIGEIRKLLRDRDTLTLQRPQGAHLSRPVTLQPVVQRHQSYLPPPVQAWNQSAHIRDFVQSLVEDNELRQSSIEADKIISSLQNLLSDGSHGTSETSFEKSGEQNASTSLEPSLEAIVSALRWINVTAAANEGHYGRTTWLSHFLPHRRFSEICQKVYFGLEDSSLIEQVLATGYLSHVFAEHAATVDAPSSGQYYCDCLTKFQVSLDRLPLLLPSSIETIAALALGAYNATEMSDVETAWTLVTSASLQCQRIGLHTITSAHPRDSEQQAATQRLFWMVYRLEKGLALRLGRPSTIRDTEITLPTDPNEPTYRTLARIQGHVYDDLYSPAALQQPLQDRYRIAQDLASKLQVAISETEKYVLGSTEADSNPLGPLYSKAILVCQASLHVWILRAIPTVDGAASDECISAAREVMSMHHECMKSVRSFTADPHTVTKYINWSIMHVPFVPFSILFTHAVQNLRVSDLVLLERFTASLHEAKSSNDDARHPHGLYDLLCKAARLYITSKTRIAGLNASGPALILSGTIDFSDSVSENGSGYGLRDWYNENQQLMGLLDSAVDSRYL